MAKEVFIRENPPSRQGYFAVRVNLGEISYVTEHYGEPRQVQMPVSDPIFVIGRFKVKSAAESLAAEINRDLHGAT